MADTYNLSNSGEAVVCIAHGRYMPCRKEGQHRYTDNPYWAKLVRDYQYSPIEDLTWEPAWERNRQKVWVRKSGLWWEVGCQCCGRVVYEDWSWQWAQWAARRHAWSHA